LHCYPHPSLILSHLYPYPTRRSSDLGEIQALERDMRRAIEQLDRTHVIANSRDVLITSAASVAQRQSWVAAVTANWTSESNVCPRCGSYIDFDRSEERRVGKERRSRWVRYQ